MDTEQVLNQLLLIAGLLALPVPLLWMEARALQRVPRLASQPRWRERLALVPRVASIGAVLLAGAAVVLYVYYRLSPPEGLQAFLDGQPLGRDATASVNSFYGFLATVGSVTLGALAVAYGIVLLGFVALAQGRAPEHPPRTEQDRASRRQAIPAG
jgi:ABC-type Fe3+ transport system permease subunit